MRTTRWHRPWTLAVALAMGLGAAACGPSAVPASLVAPPGTSPATAAAPPNSTPPSPAAVTGTSLSPLVVDNGLLAMLPASIGDVAMQPAADTATRMAADEALKASASAIAVGTVIAPADYAGNEDLAVATVVQLRPGAGTDAFYAKWRSDYDAAACAPAGGIATGTQQTIGSHTTEVTTCAGGAKTLHTRLPGDILISVTAVGDRGYGDLVIAGLRG